METLTGAGESNGRVIWESKEGFVVGSPGRMVQGRRKRAVKGRQNDDGEKEKGKKKTEMKNEGGWGYGSYSLD